MTKYVDRNWEKWNKNVEPILVDMEAEKVQAAGARRKTLKMCEEDPDEDDDGDSGTPTDRKS